MNEKYEVRETGKDFWGRKTYEVKEKSGGDGSALGYLILVIIGLAILTIPSGIIALILYIPLKLIFLNKATIENLQSKKEKLAWGCIILGVIYMTYFYYKFFDIEKMIGSLIIACILGIFSYYQLYKIVTLSITGKLSEEEAKGRNQKRIIKISVIWGVLFALYLFTPWLNFVKPALYIVYRDFVYPVIDHFKQ
jgi:hypothetical protein